MGKWSLVLGTVGLIVAACGGSDTAGSTTATSMTSSTSTTTVATTTTTKPPAEVCEPTPLEGRPRVWAEGCVYTADSFAIPLTFTSPSGGWSSTGAAPRWIEIRHDADSDGTSDVTLTFIIFEPSSTPNEIVDTIVAIEGVDVELDRTAVTVGGNSGIVIDLLGEPDPDPGFPERNPCSRPGGSARFFMGTGYVLFTDPNLSTASAFGIPACWPTRVWVVDVGGVTITALGVVEDEDRFGELMPILEDFLESNVTFGDADG